MRVKMLSPVVGVPPTLTCGCLVRLRTAWQSIYCRATIFIFQRTFILWTHAWKRAPATHFLFFTCASVGDILLPTSMQFFILAINMFGTLPIMER